MTAAHDARFMALALSLGARGLGSVWPNPAVGCVIVNDGRIVGRGKTAQGGRPHAEVQALAQAGGAARGAVAYVSLEPCAHQGETPPCAEALVAAGVSRVVSAMEDPDPRVAGRGHKILTDAGIAVETGCLESEARRIHAGFLNRVRTGRPMVTLKLATSFDGRIATASGESRWITGAAARHAVHGLRARHDAVLVGGGTARADDPSLTVRGFGPVRQPVRVVASRRLDLDGLTELAEGREKGPLWLIHGERDVPEAAKAQWEAVGAELMACAVGSSSRLDPKAMLEVLGAKGLTRVFCEGGGALASSFLQADLVDEIVGFTAGLVLGAEGRPSIGAMGVEDLGAASRFQLVSAQDIGGDVMHRWTRRGASE